MRKIYTNIKFYISYAKQFKAYSDKVHKNPHFAILQIYSQLEYQNSSFLMILNNNGMVYVDKAILTSLAMVSKKVFILLFLAASK